MSNCLANLIHTNIYNVFKTDIGLNLIFLTYVKLNSNHVICPVVQSVQEHLDTVANHKSLWTPESLLIILEKLESIIQLFLSRWSLFLSRTSCALVSDTFGQRISWISLAKRWDLSSPHWHHYFSTLVLTCAHGILRCSHSLACLSLMPLH